MTILGDKLVAPTNLYSPTDLDIGELLVGAGSKDELVDIDYANGRRYSLTTDAAKLAVAASFEQEIWYEEGYGSLEEYAGHIARSRTITAFDGDNCVGIVRLFDGKEVPPPFATEMNYDDPEEQNIVIEQGHEGLIEELGTIAVAKHLRRREDNVFANLTRLAYRDASSRGIKSWGIIMEPPRVKAMNWAYGFTFKQLGPASDYQGGKCAPHVMNIAQGCESMSKKHPEKYEWFVNLPLSS